MDNGKLTMENDVREAIREFTNRNIELLNRIKETIDFVVDIQVGSVVRLRSGGPAMTVDQLLFGSATCVWFRGKEAMREVFRATSLKLDTAGIANSGEAGKRGE